MFYVSNYPGRLSQISEVVPRVALVAHAVHRSISVSNPYHPDDSERWVL
jgi:hypothetical protein